MRWVTFLISLLALLAFLFFGFWFAIPNGIPIINMVSWPIYGTINFIIIVGALGALAILGITKS